MKANELPRGLRWLLLALFTLVSVLAIRAFASPLLRRSDLLVLATSTAALVTSLAWFFLLGVHGFRRGKRRHAWWALAFLVPYVNLIAASYYSRFYWTQGARGPALLAICGVAAQTLVTLRMLNPPLPLLA